MDYTDHDMCGLDHSAKAYHELEHEVERLERENARYRAEVRDFEERVIPLAKAELIQAKVDLRAAFDAQVNRASFAEREVERLKKQAEARTLVIDGAEHHVRELERAVARLQLIVAESAEVVQRQENEIAEARHLETMKSWELSQSKDEVERLRKHEALTVSDNDAIIELHREIERLHARFGDPVAQDATESYIAELKAKVEQLRNQYAAMRSLADERGVEINRLRTQLQRCGEESAREIERLRKYADAQTKMGSE